MVYLAIISNDSVDSSIFNRSQERDQKTARSTGGFSWNTTNYTRYIVYMLKIGQEFSSNIYLGPTSKVSREFWS